MPHVEEPNRLRNWEFGGLAYYSERPEVADAVIEAKTPENRSAPVYPECRQHPKTHRSATHIGFGVQFDWAPNWV